MSATPLARLPLETPVSALLGIGLERSMQLERLGIRTLGDLLLHRPRRYEDRTRFLPIHQVTERGAAAVKGRIVAMGVKRFRKGTRSVFEIILDDDTARLHCRWWNMPFLEAYFTVGEEWMVYGRIVDLRPRTMDHPETERLEPGEDSIHMDRIVPIYPLTEGLHQRWLRGRIWSLLEPRTGNIPEPHPGLDTAGFPSRAAAVAALHFPRDLAESERARQRLAFDEFVELQIEIQSRRRRLFAHAPGWSCGGDNHLIRPFLKRLGFTLTGAQTEVLREIRSDLGRGHPMRRLLQGDVGSGKTVVAAAAALMAIESGFRVALMAPTELLAHQHGVRFREWFEPLGVGVVVRTGSSGRNEPAGSDPVGRSGGPMTIGTHALIASGFEPENLGLVIIDEQHKFGVAQREALLRKGRYPHLLVMTATPIPRTLALTLYGDLDVSVIREGPPGRGRVRTYVRGAARLPKVWEFVRGELEAGRQAYVVYPRIDEDGEGTVKALRREATEVGKALAPFRVGVLHGGLPAEKKQRVMGEFRAGILRVLAATVIVEVGVDVANATVMVIEGAERFGLAQLHQLRGRIGRGAHASTCVLVPAVESPEVRERLRVLEESGNGFEIAEADLRLRGAGELLGQAQSGLPPLRFGDLAADRRLLERARDAVSRWLDRRGERSC